ncbi:SMP-30/gluconolactonase/LRE family protein [Humidisolicoccus flavus]|uniref:SMP-30/gluconolactonase/LRE family protein n=1 Tax=Humidisolicoccus flavus TaxID=3111414 RepID=UPI00324A0CB3
MSRALPAHAGRFVLAEGPVCNAATGQLTWVDIEAGLVLNATVSESTDALSLREERRIATGEQIGCALPFGDGHVLLALRRCLAVVRSTGMIERGSNLLDESKRFNDGKIDPQGRLLVGSLTLEGENLGDNVLLRLEHDGSVTTIDDDLGLSNGLAWSPDGATFYSIDTERGLVYRRSYGADIVGEREILLQFDDEAPDGMSVDAEGNLWIAFWGGGGVRVFTAAGEERVDLALSIEAPHSTSIAFFGSNLDHAVVTSASRDLDTQEQQRWPDAGDLFIARVPVRGIPVTPWRETSLP